MSITRIDPTNFVHQAPDNYPPLSVVEVPPVYKSSGATAGPQEITEAALIEGAGEPPESFLIVQARELAGARYVADFVEGLLGDGAASMVYGPSNVAKSFWVLDLCFSIVSGRNFRDELEVDQGAVVYVAGEGITGMQNRIEAARREGRLTTDAPLFLIFVPVSLMEPGSSLKLAESVKQAAERSALPCRLVVIDTLSRSMPGGDENAGKDMTIAVQSIDAIRAATGAHVMAVHHTGKNLEAGARGHSSLRAAMDTEIEITRPEGSKISTARVTKQRDLPEGEPMPFSLKIVTLGIDRRGKPLTSCVVHHEDSMMAPSRPKAGRKNEVPNNDLVRLLPRLSTADWLKAAMDETGISKTAFYRQLKELRKSAVSQTQSQGWILAPTLEIPKYSRNQFRE